MPLNVGTVQKKLFISKFDLNSRKEIFLHTIDGVRSCRYRWRFSIVEEFGHMMRHNQKELVIRLKRTWSSTWTGNSLTTMLSWGCFVEFNVILDFSEIDAKRAVQNETDLRFSGFYDPQKENSPCRIILRNYLLQTKVQKCETNSSN